MKKSSSFDSICMQVDSKQGSHNIIISIQDKHNNYCLDYEQYDRILCIEDLRKAAGDYRSKLVEAGVL